MIKFEKSERMDDDFDSKEYAVSEIKEPVINTIGKSVITRCRYGAEVINMPSSMSIDIDYTLKIKGEAQTLNDTVELAEEIAEDSELTFRIYRTFKGLRVIIIGREFNPRSYASDDLMNQFGCDIVYAILCIKQNCFRLRLTPKPERIGFGKADKYDGSQGWIDRYNADRSGFASARFIRQIGPEVELPDEIKVHDKMTGSFTELPLA